MSRVAFAGLILLMLAGCASEPRKIRGASISEVGERAQSEDPDDRTVKDVPTRYDWDYVDEPDYEPTHSDSSYRRTREGSPRAEYDPGTTEYPAEAPTLDNVKIWVQRQFAEPPSHSFYQTQTAWGLGIAGFDSTRSVGTSIYYAPGRFTVSEGDSLEDPLLLGWQVDVSARHALTDQITLGYGGGFTLSVLLWQYANPLQDWGGDITGDSLDSFGLVLPLTLESRYGPVMTELTVTPTLRIFSDYTTEGFENNLGQLHGSLPIALRVGMVF